MPTREAITNNIIAQEAPKPIPERIAVTRPVVRKSQANQIVSENGNQENINVNSSAAESATTEESVKLSPQLSAIARKEQAFRQRDLTQKQRDKDFEQDLALAKEYKELKAKIEAKDYSEAEKMGIKYDDYVQYLIDKQNGEDPQLQKFKTLEDEIKALKKGQEEKETQEFEETVSAYRTEIASLTSSNPEFSTIKGKKAEEHVLQLIIDSWEEDDVQMTVEEACKDVEAALVADANSYLDLPKFKPTVEEKKLPPPKPGVRTLTNQMQATSSEARPTKPLHSLSDGERYAEARRRVEARKLQQGR